jgi:hypothetical protein
MYAVRWEGELQVDSLAPAITEATPLPSQVPADTMLSFSLTATDEDSLWLTQIVAWRTDSEDTLFIPLEHESGSTFTAVWHVQDTAQWLYYYHAEDMWENITYLPIEGPGNPWTMQSGSQDAATLTPLPQEFVIKIFPNPVNSTLTISGSRVIWHQPMTLNVYDILGREVTRLTVPAATDPTFTIHWDTKDSHGLPLPTGTYFIHPESTLSPSGTKSLIIIR